MAQISYGTITITDTNDIESIIVEYARNQSTSSAPTSGWSTTRPTWAQGYYIWQRTRTHKAGTSTDSDTYGTAVCITGSTGQTGGTGAAGRSLTNTVTQYTTATNSVTITQSNMGNYTWNSNVPSYSSSNPAYWVRVTNTYSNPSSTEYIIYKDNGLTDAIAKSVEANNNAAIANSIAQSANENANGAMSQAAETQYRTEALAAKVKNYWWDLTGAHIASGINGADVTEGTASTYGFNSLVGLASITFGYNSYKTVELDGTIPALKLYKPSKTIQGTQTAQVDSDGLKIYNSSGTLTSIFGNSITLASNGATITIGATGNNNSNVYISSSNLQLRRGTTANATLDGNGLTLIKGGIQAGTSRQNGFIYLSTEDYPLKDATHEGLTINGHTPTVAGIDGRITDDFAWREVIGTKFGVDSDGQLWVTQAHITGSINATDFQARDGNGNIRAIVDSNGLTVKDAAGNMVAAFSGSGINFSNSVSQKIGGTNNYIEFNATDNSINIIGDSIIFDSLNDTNSALSDLTNRVTENETNITNQSEIISQQSETLSGVVESTNENTHVLNELVESSDELTTYVKSHMIVTSEGLFLQLDGSSSGVQINGTGVFLYDKQGILAEYSNVVRLGDAKDAHITLSPTNGLGFYIGKEDVSNPRTNRVAYISSENLVIDKSEIIDTFRIGNFMWKVQSENRISLMFSPRTGG